SLARVRSTAVPPTLPAASRQRHNSGPSTSSGPGGSERQDHPHTPLQVMLDLAPYSLKLGHATDLEGGTGCTVIRGDTGPFRASYYLLGRATGTREVDALQPGHLVDRTDAILLTGGSAFGL